MPRQSEHESREDALRGALDDSMRRNERGLGMDNEGAVPLMRMVDMRIPLPWLLGLFALTGAGVIGMYYQLQSVARELGELKVTVTASNSQSLALASEVALLRFRVEQHEKDIAKLVEARPR